MPFVRDLLWKFGGRRVREALLKAELESWRVVHIRNDSLGQELVVRIRIKKPSISRPYSTAVLIEWGYEESSRSLPDSATTEKMTNFERAIDLLTSENGFSELVFVRTGLGKREWLFYTRDPDKFSTELNRCLTGHSVYPLKMLFDDDPTWGLWKGFVTDLKPHMQNRSSHQAAPNA